MHDLRRGPSQHDGRINTRLAESSVELSHCWQGSAFLQFPGVGPFIAAGPIMGALAGLGVGGAVGGLIGDDDPRTAKAMAGLGRLYTESGKYYEASHLLHNAKAIAESSTPHGNAAHHYSGLGRLSVFACREVRGAVSINSSPVGVTSMVQATGCG
jgi:hypothetical protein